MPHNIFNFNPYFYHTYSTKNRGMQTTASHNTMGKVRQFEQGILNIISRLEASKSKSLPQKWIKYFINVSNSNLKSFFWNCGTGWKYWLHGFSSSTRFLPQASKTYLESEVLSIIYRLILEELVTYQNLMLMATMIFQMSLTSGQVLYWNTYI